MTLVRMNLSGPNNRSGMIVSPQTESPCSNCRVVPVRRTASR